MKLKLSKISNAIYIAAISSIATTASYKAFPYDLMIDDFSYEHLIWNDFQRWEYDPCLRDSPAYIQDRQFAYVALNNDVDIMTGSAHVKTVDYDSGHDILPLKLERIYKTAGSFKHFGRSRTQWFSSLEYGITNLGDAIKSATSAGNGNASHEDCDGFYGFGDRPLVLAQGTAGAISLYGKINALGIIEWYKRKNRQTPHSKVNLAQNNDSTWTYIDAETGTIQHFDAKGKILSIIDAATQISLTWSYSNGYERVTRTGGEWLQKTNISNNQQTILTSGGATYQYSKTSYNGGLNALKVKYPDTDNNKYNDDYIVYSYNNDGLLLYEDINGTRTREFSWNSHGLVTRQKVGNETTSFSYTGFPARYPTDTTITVINSKGRSTEFTYDRYHHELKRIFSYGGNLPESTSHYSGTNGYFSGIVTETDALGRNVSYQLDDKSRETSRTEAINTVDERTQTTAWFGEWHLPQRVENDTTITEYSYYSATRPLVTAITVTDKLTGAVRITRYSYQFYSNGLISQIEINGPRDDIQDISYQYFSSNGRLSKTVDALNRTTSYGNYDADGRYTTITYPDSSVKTFTYNNRGHISNERVSNNQGTASTLYTYDAQGNVISETNPAAIKTTRLYGAKGDLHQETRGNFRKLYYYDELGKLSKERYGLVNSDIDALVGQESCQVRDNEDYNCHTYTVEDSFTETKVSTYTHDALGRLAATTDSRGYKTQYIYDVLNRVTSTIDANNITIEKQTYDNLGRVKTTTDAIGRVTQYDYDTNNNVIRIQDNANRIFSFSYNGFGQLISSDTPADGQKSYLYDDAGNLITEYLNDNSAIQYSYDALNRLQSRTTIDGIEHNFTYDTTTYGTGLLGTTTEESGKTSYTYNSLTRDISEQDYTIGSKSYRVSYAYDASGRISTMTYPSGYKLSYSYHAGNGTLLKISDSKGNTLANNIQFNPFGPVKSLSLIGNGTVSYNWDKDYRLKKITATRYGVGYNFDKVGHITEKLNSSGGRLSAYSYFNNYELKSETQGTQTTTYSYDTIGNRLTENSIRYIYNNDKKLTSYNNSEVRYDGRGNIIHDSVHGGITSRSFNALNQQTKSVKSAKTTTYQYDAQGHRTVKNGQYGNIHFIHDVNGKLLAEAINGIVKKEYIYLGNSLLAVYYNNAVHPVFTDITGRPEIATNASGTIVWQASNTAFNRSVTSNALGDLNIGYPGQYYDKETDTWYNLKRDYDAKTGRYLQSDPKGTIDGPNTYLYAGNNPVNRIDPSGEYFWVIVGAAVDIGLQAYQNGWDFGKVDYADVALNAANPARFIKWGTKGYKASQDARQVAAAGNQLSVSQGIVAQGGKKVGAASAIKESSSVTKKVDYSSIKNPPNVGPGKDFILRQKQEALELNKAANGGVVKSDASGTTLVKPQKSQRGVTPDPNEWQFDHIVPKNCGGTNCSSNLQILSRQENRIKSDN